MMRVMLALFLLAAPSHAALWADGDAIGTGSLSGLHKVFAGNSVQAARELGGDAQRLGDGAFVWYRVAKRQGWLGQLVYDSVAGSPRRLTAEERQEYRSQQEEARDPGGVNRNRKAGLAAYLALESPTPAQTVAALKALIREVGASQ